MIRLVIENIVLFLLPTLLYLVYAYVKSARDGRPGSFGLDEAPIVWLLFAGAVLMLLTFAYFATDSGGRPGQAYTPPSFDGKGIRPGDIQ